MAGEGEGATLEYTPTWVVALVCTIIVAISLAAERILHFAGKYMLKKNQPLLFQALQKIKEGSRHLLATASDTATAGYCDAKGKAPLLSQKALHDLHIFIFVLALSHVVFSALTILFGRLRIRQWRHWEDSIQKKLNHGDDDPEEGMVTHVQHHAYFSKFSSGIGRLPLFGWLISILKQFYGPVEKLEYRTLRRGFIRTHCRGNPKFNFYKYMIRALEYDFKKVVGISWYLWIFVVLFLLLNVYVGAKLEHIMRQLAEEVSQKHTAVIGEPEVQPSDHHFWFHRPRIVLVLIHVVLFQNAFEIAVFFWMLSTFGFDSCIMGQVRFIIPRLVIGVIVQLLCSYSTLPLYAIVARMGSSYNMAIFEDHIQAGLVGWAQKVKKNKQKGGGHVMRDAGAGGPSSSNHNQVAHHDSPLRVEMSTTRNQVQNSSEIMDA
ncbi:UNVERIFIED_CONTAM: MLO-like protein 1 [Sesamum radiatum]|uniref:MLO-like protein n=1 Tax=Sesamum radiatum TaxID=300843 RepID=A0AAW2NE19_SESRA